MIMVWISCDTYYTYTMLMECDNSVDIPCITV